MLHSAAALQPPDLPISHSAFEPMKIHGSTPCHGLWNRSHGGEVFSYSKMLSVMLTVQKIIDDGKRFCGGAGRQDVTGQYMAAQVPVALEKHQFFSG